MRIIKNINSNYAMAVDSAGNLVVLSGKGIGYGPCPRELSDLSTVNRSFYDVDEKYISIINNIPDELILISASVIDKANITLNNRLNNSIIFTLADHLTFAIKRVNNKMNINMPFVYDVKHLYYDEYKLGLYALKLINAKLGIYLPEEEAGYVALHLINAEEQIKNSKENDNDYIISQITEEIEKYFQIKVNRDDFNFARFVSHMYYLLQRSKSKHLLFSDNTELFNKVVEEYPDTYKCSLKIGELLEKKTKTSLNDEEILYLILHINRLCSRVDCNQ